MREPRHIAIFLPSLQGGGAERVMVDLANGFAARGHTVDLVLARAEGPYLGEVSNQVRLFDLQASRTLASLLPLVRYLRRERPDAILSALNHANLVAIVARALSGIRARLVVSERTSLASVGTGLAAFGLRALMRLLYPWADGVIAVSQGVASELVAQLSLRRDRVSAVPNPVDGERIAELAKERPSHPWLLPDQPPVVLAVGRLAPQKDYPTLLAAFAELRQRVDARLIILGEGELRVALLKTIAERGLSGAVHLAGFQPNPFGWMAASDVYVLSSRFEGFPNTLVQAMACGARVVSTDCPTGPSEILENGRWGRLVEVGDVSGLAESVFDALTTNAPPNVRDRAADFRRDIITNQYEAVLLGRPSHDSKVSHA